MSEVCNQRLLVLNLRNEEDVHMMRHFILPDERDVYIAERLFSSSLVAVVSGASPRTLRIEHFKKVWKYSPLNTLWRLLPGNWNMSVFLRRPHSSSADEQSGEWRAWSDHDHDNDNHDPDDETLKPCWLPELTTSWRNFQSPQRLVVCLEESLYIHNIRDMKVTVPIQSQSNTA